MYIAKKLAYIRSTHSDLLRWYLNTYIPVYSGSLVISDKGKDTRKPDGLTITLNARRGPNRKKTILITEGCSFIAHVIRDN